MTDIDLAALRAKAEAAKRCNDNHEPANHLGQFLQAVCNPSVVLALLDRVEEAEAERTLACDELGHVYRKTDRLRSLLARAGEALRPFADDELHEGLGDGPDNMQTWWPGMRLGDYRAARTVAAEIEEIGHE